MLFLTLCLSLKELGECVCSMVAVVTVVLGLTVGRTITWKGRWRMNISALTTADSFSGEFVRSCGVLGIAILSW